ncbi:polysaccharide pyruvyl transferase family protein [Photobacterium damselae subsp. damselae]|uniref:polysaccharide pyruvyl transferase family protein n=1 Tax=Photobacterium damselae TaxID=38293 RepID=UPI00311AEA09
MILEPKNAPTKRSQMNVGDDLNFYIFPQLIGNILNDNERDIFLGIGTLLTKNRFKRLENADSITIFGSGAWDSDIPNLTKNCNIIGVRGYRTAAKLGLPMTTAIGDAAYLLPSVDYPKRNCQGKIGFIPHQSSERYIDWQKLCDDTGLEFITPKQPVEDFLLNIQECKLVITEAMHGAIIADALRIPWVPVKFAPDFCEEKWFDFAEYMGLNIEFKELTFMRDKDIPIIKNIENLSRKILANIFNLSRKKKTAPTVFFKCSDKKKAILRSQLITCSCAQSFLSNDAIFQATVHKQYTKIIKFSSTGK